MGAKNKAAEKRQRQDERKYLANKMVKSAIRTSAKKIVIASKEQNKAEAGLALAQMIKKIDTAARKGIVKKNAAARKKSRMQKLYNALA